MKVKEKILPPTTTRWRKTAIFFMAVVIGLGLFMAKESRVISYMSDNPQACVNCHVMTPMYNSWMHSSHREYANCNDCHVPHNNVFNKYYFKAKDGMYHASIFTARLEPDVIEMKKASQEVVQSNCIRCHVQQVTQAKFDGYIDDHRENRTGRQCWSCHVNVPHGTVHGLSTIKFNVAPLPTDQQELVIPKWMEEQIEQED